MAKNYSGPGWFRWSRGWQRTAGGGDRAVSELPTMRELSLGDSSRMPNAVTASDSASIVKLMSSIRLATIRECFKNALYASLCFGEEGGFRWPSACLVPVSFAGVRKQRNAEGVAFRLR